MIAFDTWEKRVFALIEFFSNIDIFHKNRICNRIVSKIGKWSLIGLVYALYFTLVSLPAFAASTGNIYLYSSFAAGTSMCRLSILLLELVVLGVNSQFIMSDMRVIRWFENKKKSRL